MTSRDGWLKNLWRRLREKRSIVLLVLLVVGLVVAGSLLLGWVGKNALDEQLAKSVQQLQLHAAFIETELARYEAVPGLLASNQRVIKVLQQPQNTSARQALNEYLEHSAASTGALDIYLMDRQGLTLAASNWQSPATFIDRNFAYRPYFRQAVEGAMGRYYALGTTSRQRGYYFASPTYILGQVAGVVVVKVDMAGLEQRLRSSAEQLLVSDPDGVVFLSTMPSWLYRSMRSLTPVELQRIDDSARYPDIDIRPLDLDWEAAHGPAGLIHSEQPEMQGSLMQLDHRMPQVGWTLHLLSSLKPVKRRVLDVGLLFLSVSAVLVLMGAILLQKRARDRERVRCDLLAREALKKAHDELEIRVQERTADLRHQVEERQRAEQALRMAQDELIQAAKLAMLGQMSASINHEINQPLTAIRGYADNARKLLDRARYQEVDGNLQQIGELVDRMGQISSQLKLFARKSSGQRGPVSLRNALEVSLKILDRTIRNHGIKVECDVGAEDVTVLADETRLGQVLVNLIGNAAHALEGTQRPRIRVRTELLGRHIQVAISDNGPGIPAEHLEQIFDPFFTTRKSGLGLGLAISQNIVENMGGAIRAANLPDGGAEFSLTLELADGGAAESR